MIEAIMLEWIKKVLVPFKLPPNTMKYLIMDLCSSHKKDYVLKLLTENKIFLSLIPGGCTSILQPLDVVVNKPLKDYIRQKFEAWFLEKVSLNANLTKKGYIK